MYRCGPLARTLKYYSSKSASSTDVWIGRFLSQCSAGDIKSDQAILCCNTGGARHGFAVAASRRPPEEAAAEVAAEDSEDDEAASSCDEESHHVPYFRLETGQGVCSSAPAVDWLKGKPTNFEAGRLARLAAGSCSVTRGGTQVLAAMMYSPLQGARRTDGLTVQVDYRERLFASGRMPKNSVHMEGPPSAKETAACHSVKTAIRSLLDPTLPYGLQVSLNVMSADGVHEPIVTAINATSAALAVSTLPAGGPIGAVRVTVNSDGRAVVDAPVDGDMAARPRLRMLVVGTRSGIVMLEAEGAEAQPEDFATALLAAEPAVESLIKAQEHLAQQAQVNKVATADDSADPAALAIIAKLAQQAVLDAVRNPEGGIVGRMLRLQAIKDHLTKQLHERGAWRFGHNRKRGSGCVLPSDMEAGIDALVRGAVRGLAINSNVRPDGRGLLDLQPVHCEVGEASSVHGSALYQGGETQVAGAATVASTDARDIPEGDEKPLFVHYSQPLFASASDQVSRRLGGHATAAEVYRSNTLRDALLPSFPARTPQFPWTVRVNADTLAANGSSLMAAVSAASLALHATGLPIKGLTAGVSIGVVARPGAQGSTEGSGRASWVDLHDDVTSPSRLPVGHELLVDTQGVEQQAGESELHVAGTRQGITAVRLEVSHHGASVGTVLAGLRAAQSALQPILGALEAAAFSAADKAPQRLIDVFIEPAMIGRFIGPAGASIKAAEKSTGAQFAVDDSGRIFMYAPRGNVDEAAEAVKSAVDGNVRTGQQYTAEVVRIMDYGAFVKLEDTGNTQGLLHISEMSNERIRSVADAVKLGQKLEVVCTGRDARGNIKLSAKAVIQDM